MDKADKRVMKSIRSREPLCEPFIKLSMILKTGGIKADGYLGMCGDRISDALLIDGEDVRIDFVNFPDMELTAAGVRICRDILECYVSGDIVSDAYVALMEEKVVRVHVNTISQTLQEMKLRGLVSAFIKSDSRIRRFVVEEICQRSILIRCFRKIRGVYYGILVRVKYYELFSGVGRIAAENSGE